MSTFDDVVGKGGGVNKITLGEDLPKEIERVQKIIEVYEEVPCGHISTSFMKEDVAKAQKALNDVDIVGMIRAYQNLKSYEY